MKQVKAAHYFDGKDWFADTAFMNSLSRSGLKGEMVHMGMGEFTWKAPDGGEVEFDRMRGKDFPGQSGRSHKLYDNRNGKLVEEMIKAVEKKGLSEKITAAAFMPRVTARRAVAKALRYIVRAAGLSTEASELLLYAQNDGQLYRQRVQPIQKNLEKKWRSGKYDHNIAWKIWMYALEDAAKKYVKDMGSPGDKWNMMFPKNDRIEAAKRWADEWKDEAELEFGPLGGA